MSRTKLYNRIIENEVLCGKKYPVFRNVKSYAKATEEFEYFYNAKTPEDAEKADEDRRLILGLKMAT